MFESTTAEEMRQIVYPTRRGRGIDSCVYDYLFDSMWTQGPPPGTTDVQLKQRLVNHLQLGKGYALVLKYFGFGLFILFPSSWVQQM